MDDEVADDEVYSDAPRSSGPAGRPSQSECLISYFWFSYFVAALFSLLLLLFLIFCPSRLSSPSHRPAAVSRSHVPNHRTRSVSRHQPCKLESLRRLSALRRIPGAFSVRSTKSATAIVRDSTRPNRRLPDNSSTHRETSSFLDRIKIVNIALGSSSRGELQPGRKINRERNFVLSVKHLNGIFKRDRSR